MLENVGDIRADVSS